MATWCIADLHGHLEIWKKVKEIVDPDDTIYVLGDCVDRGPQSWETLKAVYDDPQARLLKGNHEDMLVKACAAYLEDDYMWDYRTYALCRMNGGEDTMDAWERDPDREAWVKKLRDLPTWDVYESPSGRVFLLSHAGFTPWMCEDVDECIIPIDEKLIWDREHYLEDWKDDEMDDVIIVHGHTPIHHLSEDLWVEWDSGAFWYADNHKVCIDSGGFFSDEFILLNLDTLEDIVLTLDK